MAEAPTFKTELLPEDLPERPEIGLHEAASWLCGLPIKDLEPMADSAPNKRLKDAIGRRKSSAQFWHTVLRYLIDRKVNPDTLFRWSDLVFDTPHPGLVAEARRPRTLERLTRAMESYLARHEAGRSADAVFEEWDTQLRAHAERIWAYRNATVELAEKIEQLVPDERVGQLTDVVDGVERGLLGLRLSLKDNALYRLAAPRIRGNRGFEMWRSTAERDGERDIVIHPVILDRQKLIDVFVNQPDAEKARWIRARKAERYWTADFAIAFELHGRDLAALYTPWTTHEGFGSTVPFSNLGLLEEPDHRRIAARLERLLRSGKLTSWGRQAPRAAMEPMEGAEWVFLRFGHPDNSPKLAATDDEDAREALWWDVVVCAQSLQRAAERMDDAAEVSIPQLCMDDGAEVSTPRLCMDVERTEQQQVFELVAFLRENDPSKWKKDDVFDEVLGEAVSRDSRSQRWFAALLFLPSERAVQWRRSGPRTGNK